MISGRFQYHIKDTIVIGYDVIDRFDYQARDTVATTTSIGIVIESLKVCSL